MNLLYKNTYFIFSSCFYYVNYISGPSVWIGHVHFLHSFMICFILSCACFDFTFWQTDAGNEFPF